MNQRCSPRPITGGTWSRPSTRWRAGCVALLLIAPGLLVAAESGDTVEALETRKSAVAADTGLAEDLRTNVVDLFTQAIQTRRETADNEHELKALQARIKSAPERLKGIAPELEQAAQPTPLPKNLERNPPLERVEQAIRDETERLERLSRELKDREQELARLQQIPKTVSAKIVEATERQSRLEGDLKAPPDPTENARLVEARREALSAKRDRRESQLRVLRLNRDNHDLLTRLTTAERDLAAAQVARSNGLLDNIQDIARALRETLVESLREEAEQARRAASELPGAVRVLADRTVELSNELEQLTRREGTVSEQLDAARARLLEIKSEYAATRQQVEVVGRSDAIARLLRNRLDLLPSLSRYRRASRDRSAAISSATDRRIDLEEQRRQLPGTDERVNAIVDPVTLAWRAEEKQRLADEVRRLVAHQEQRLEDLSKTYGRYVNQLTALDVTERQLVTVAQDFIAFIKEELLWIRSTTPIAWSDLGAIPHAFWLLVSPDNGSRLVDDVTQAAKQEPLRVVLVLLLAAVLLHARRRAPARLAAPGQSVGKIRSDSYLFTAQALLQTLILAGTWPLLLGIVGWQLGSFSESSAFSIAVGHGLVATAALLFIISLFSQIARPGGLADKHFRWNPEVRAVIFRELQWFVYAGPPLVFIVATTLRINDPQAVPGLGRPAFVGLSIVLILLAFKLFRRDGKLATYLKQQHAGGWLSHLHFVWYPLLVSAPLALALVSLAGFHYTALHFGATLYQTAWVILGLLLVKDLLLRSFTMTERRLRFEEAVKRREEILAQRQKDEGGEEERSAAPVEIEEVNYAQLGEQAKRLMRTALMLGGVIGIWWTWADFLPVLAFGADVALPFTKTELLDGVEKEVAVTLADLGIAVVLIVVTVIAAKNLPGLLEITLLQRLPLDPGGRYAITTLAQYTIAAIGIIVVFGSIGLQWSKLQWLVAALSVGLGFGLQEIVANFVSGIILLFERPIRVGDIVRVGDTTGKVARIRIRATTIVNWDRQELIVPNKEFITNQVLNWSLSDQINRIVITIGIAYGSDVTKALELLMEAAQEHPRIMADPAAKVTFEGFGDNALTLLLRCYLDSLEFRLETITELHQAINDKFNEAGIEISFPQRDLHLDTPRPLDIRIIKPGPERP